MLTQKAVQASNTLTVRNKTVTVINCADVLGMLYKVYHDARSEVIPANRDRAVMAC